MSDDKEILQELTALREKISTLTEENEVLHSKVDELENSVIFSYLPYENVFIHENGICKGASDSICSVFGYTREEIIGQNIIKMLVAENSLDIIMKHVKEEYTQPYIVDIRKKSGEIVAVELVSRNNPSGINNDRIVVFRDVTDQKKAESLLQESEELFRTAFDNANIGVAMVSLDGTYQNVNDSFCKMLGYTREELNLLSFNDITHMDDKEIGATFLQKMVAGSLSSCDFEKRYVHKEGQVVWVNVSVSIVRKGKNTPQYFVTYIYNITDRKRAEKELLKNEEKFRSIFETSKDSILIVDQKTGNIVDANQSACKLYGYKRDEFLKLKSTDVSAEPDKTAIALHNLEIDIPLLYHHKKDGAVFPVEIAGGYFKQGNRLIHAAFIRDITERKRADNILQESQAHLDLALRSANMGVWSWNVAENKREFNHQTCCLLGINPDTFKGTTEEFFNVIHPDDWDKIKLAHQKTLEEDQMYESEYRVIWPDGSMHFISARGKLVRNNEGRPLKINGIIWDITERYNSDLKLTESETRYRLVTEKTPVALFLYHKGCFIYLNPAALKMLHAKSEEELIGQAFIDRVHPDYRSKVADNLKLVEEHKIHPELIEEQFICLDGTIIDVQVQDVLLEFHDQKVVLVFAQDITDRKKAEQTLKSNEELLKQQNEDYLAINEELSETNARIKLINEELIVAKEKAEESDRLKSAFLANMSHEIRTPMNAIIGFADFLTMPDLPETKKQWFSHLIKERSYDLLRIVEDIVDISKIEVGQMQVVETEFILSDILEQLYELYEPKKINKNTKCVIALKLAIEPSLKDIKIKTDGQRLKQILNNLLDNSFKFTQKGSIEFGCKQYSLTEILFYVKDTGIGIPKNKQEIIFDSFRQAEDSYQTREYGGTGLGLSIVKGIIKLLNGKLWLESEVDTGSAFYFTLPFYPVPTLTDVSATLAIDQKSNWRHKTILLVEDDEPNMEYLKEALLKSGVKILTAYTGDEALQTVNTNPQINLVLMDIRLPDSNGLILTRIIKETNPEMIVIAQTAYAAPNDIKNCMDAGCNAYIAKPINRDKLLALVGQFLNAT